MKSEKLPQSETAALTLKFHTDANWDFLYSQFYNYIILNDFPNAKIYFLEEVFPENQLVVSKLKKKNKQEKWFVERNAFIEKSISSKNSQFFSIEQPGELLICLALC